MLLHGLEQRGLDLGRRAIDLIGEQDVGEDRPLTERKRARGQVVHRGAQDVGRHEVRGELDTAVLQRQRPRDGLREQRLASSRHALEQHVALGDQRDRAQADRIVLADDRLGELLSKTRVELGGGGRRGPCHLVCPGRFCGGWAIA